MTQFSKEEQDYITKLASALRSVEISVTELADMRLLYKSTNGLRYELDMRERPQGPTIRSSSTLGSKIKRALGDPESYYGMNYVGRSRGDQKWVMADVFRAAIDQANLFANAPVVADALIPWDETDDEIDEEEKIADEIANDESLTETMRDQLRRARLGQGKFRERVQLVSPACRLTGVTHPDFLIASHIKPWRDCDNEERLDGNNGLMLSPHIDHLFDEGFISFEDDGCVIISVKLSPEILKAWSIDVSLNAGHLNEQQKQYMTHHREFIFQK